MSQVLLYNRHMFVWLDKLGCDNCNYIRKYGYSIRGLTPRCRRLLASDMRQSCGHVIQSCDLNYCVCMYQLSHTII